MESSTGRTKQAESCPTLPIWLRLNGLIEQFLESVTLADLMEEAK